MLQLVVAVTHFGPCTKASSKVCMLYRVRFIIVTLLLLASTAFMINLNLLIHSRTIPIAKCIASKDSNVVQVFCGNYHSRIYAIETYNILTRGDQMAYKLDSGELDIGLSYRNGAYGGSLLLLIGLTIICFKSQHSRLVQSQMQ